MLTSAFQSALYRLQPGVRHRVFPGEAKIRKSFQAHDTKLLNARTLGNAEPGFALAVFTIFLREYLLENKIQNMIFLARDGYLLKELWKLYQERTQAAGPGPGWQGTTRYCLLSRKSVAPAALCRGLTPELLKLLPGEGLGLTLGELASVFSLPFPVLAHHSAKILTGNAGRTAEPEKPLTKEDYHRLMASSALREWLIKAGHVHKQLLKDYLSPFGFFSRNGNDAPLALVDLGWNATMQKLLMYTFAAPPGNPTPSRDELAPLRGIYFGLNRRAPGTSFSADGRHRAVGLIQDNGRPGCFEEACLHFPEIFESLCRSPDPTTIGYERSQGMVRPVPRPEESLVRQVELKLAPLLKSMREGALERAKKVFDEWLSLEASLEPEERSEALGWLATRARLDLDRFIFFPDRDRANFLAEISHTEDFGRDLTLETAGPPGVSFRHILLHPGRLIKLLKQARWKAGALARTRLRPALFILRLIRFRRCLRKNKQNL